MKIGFISGDWSDIEDPDTGHPTPGGAGWYRMALPSMFLKENGIDTVYCELISVDFDSSDRGVYLHDFDGVTHDDCDMIVVQRWMDERAAEVITYARSAGQIVVNDVDDWYWGLSPKNSAYEASDPKKNPKSNRNHYRRAVNASNAITVSTPFLRDQLSADNAETHLIRNAIDLRRWEYEEPKDTPNPVVGWVGSTQFRSGDLETVSGTLQQVCKRLGASFMHAGLFGTARHAGELAGVPEEIWMTEEGVSILEYPTLFEQIDIGIVPLSDIPFNHAKSAIKGMEYAASGVPFVAQASPEYEWLRTEMGIGITAKKPAHWVKRLLELSDADVRIEKAKENREALEALNMDRRWVDWLEVYESLV